MQPTPPAFWHLFCRVIDNFGDIGVAWRLARQLVASGQRVTLWCDDARALAWMAPSGDAGVQVKPWPQTIGDSDWPDEAAVVVELFGCELPDAAQTRIAQHRSPLVWLNLEYLSAEAYVARSHRLPSPVMQGPAAGRRKWFFYPGFTADTGGLLREAPLLAQQAQFDRATWRLQHASASEDATWISLFCYEPQALPQLIAALAPDRHRLLVTPGRAHTAVEHTLGTSPWPRHIQALECVSQDRFDRMLWACDLNFVRGEDSLVRAIWAGQALVWQIYPQDDHAHHDKLHAFLDWLDAPADLRSLHAQWNGMASGELPALTPERLRAWQAVVLRARQRLLAQADLCSQLRQFVAQALTATQ